MRRTMTANDAYLEYIRAKLAESDKPIFSDNTSTFLDDFAEKMNQVVIDFIRKTGVTSCEINVFQVTKETARVDIDYPGMPSTPVTMTFPGEWKFIDEQWFLNKLKERLVDKYDYKTVDKSKDGFYLMGWT